MLNLPSVSVMSSCGVSSKTLYPSSELVYLQCAYHKVNEETQNPPHEIGQTESIVRRSDYRVYSVMLPEKQLKHLEYVPFLQICNLAFNESIFPHYY